MQISSQLKSSLFISSDVNIRDPLRTQSRTGMSALPSKSRLISEATLSIAASIRSFERNGLNDLSNSLTLLITVRYFNE